MILRPDPYGRLHFASVFDDGSAAGEGIAAGDFILEIDGRLAVTMGPNEAASLIAGPIGSSVELVIQRGGEAPRSVVLVRREILPTLVDVEIGDLSPGGWRPARDGRIALVRIAAFEFPDRWFTQWEQIRRRIDETPTIEAVLLDLRNNPGGNTATVVFLDDFLPRGKQIVEFVVEIGEPESQPLYSDGSPSRLQTLPVVVLTNRLTASVAEMVTAALHYQRDAPVVGLPTTGKYVMQGPIGLAGGAYEINVTFAHFYVPSRRRAINTGPIIPDIEAEDDPSTLRDEALERAAQELVARLP